MSPDPRAAASRTLFLRYLAMIEIAQSDPDPLAQDPRLSLDNLAWMCRTGADEAESLPLDKISRWLGFVQGCLIMRGLADVDTERDVSRPLFHAAYEILGLLPPESRDKDAD